MASKRNMRTIPPEIITEILYRLPTKSIGRFRSVSKSWLSQLTDPEFIKTHRNTLNQTHLIWRSSAKGSAFLHSHPFHYGETVITPSKFNVDIDKGALGISCSCDGLVLVCVYYDDDTHSAVVINPTTRETLQLPEDYCNFHEINYVDLVTDTLYGFGYDLVTDDYKVVSVTYFRYYTDQLMDDVEGVYVYVYSLRNNTWRRVIDSPYIQYITDGVFVNGFIHWIARKGRSYDDLLVITAFSLADESFSDVPSPKLCDATHMWQLFVVAGKLAIHLDVEGELWLMNEYMKQESWTRILLHEVHISRPRFGDDPMVFYDNGKILVANSNWMMVYDAEKAAFTKTVFVWNPEKLLLVGTYIESLVSLKLSKGEENTHDQDRQTGKRKDIDSSSAPLKLKLVFSSPLPGDIPGPSSSETFDPKLIPHRLEDGVPLHHAQEFALRPNLQATEAMKNTEAMRQNLQATGHVVDTLLRDIEQKNVIILDLERKVVSEGYDSWKAKHLEEKLRADRLEEKVNHALRKQQFLSHRLEEKEATIQSKLAEIICLQAFERRAKEQEFTLVEKNEELLEKGRALDTANAEIESLKARLAMADQERRNAVAALQR